MLTQVIISALLGIAASQVTLTAPNIGYSEEAITIAGSIVSAGPDATTIKLGCPSTSLDCGLFPEQTFVYGPSTYNMNMGDPSEDADFTGTQDCIVASTAATCMESFSGTEANFPGSSTEEYSEIGSLLIQITAGSDKLTAPASAKATPTASGAPTTGSANSGMPTLTAKPSGSSGAAASGTSSAPSQVSTGAAVGNAAMIGGGGLFGVAAGVFGGLLL